MATKKKMHFDVSMDSDEPDLEVDSNFTQGDLGFGLGLKPGALPADMADASLQWPVTCGAGDASATACGDAYAFSIIPILSMCEVESHAYVSRRHSAPQMNLKIEHDCTEEKKQTDCFGWDGQANINIGFFSVLKNLLIRPGMVHSDLDSSGDQETGIWTAKHQKCLFAKLQAATQEICVLQSELEATKRQLDSKYRAIKILQSQAIVINREQTRSILEAGDARKAFEREINSLQFDLSTSKECAMLSQQTWAGRFDRVCMENETLAASLRARSEQVRCTQLEKRALMRERDELLAMMDAKERLQYDRHKSATNDAYLHNSMAQQFGVLGACLCRGSKPDPCGCAKAAARLKKENDLLKDEVDELKQNLAAVTLMADSFRTAFDNQLDQNSLLSQKINRLCQDGRRSLWNRSSKSSHWRKKVCQNGLSERDDHKSGSCSTEDVQHELLSANHTDTNSANVAVQASESMSDIICTLADMLNDKTEALAHQRLVAKMLARKNQDLERTVEQFSEYNKH